MSSKGDEVAGLRARLARLEATVRALVEEKVDAVVSGSSQAPVLLRQAQDALRRSEARFRALVENSSDGIALLDAGGKVVYASQSCQRVLGYAPEELVGRSFPELVHPEDLERVQQEVAEALDHPGVAVRSLGRVRHKDGSWRVIEGIDTNRFDEPDVGALVVNFRDATERFEAEGAVQQSERQFRAVFDSALEAMIVADDDGNYVDVNPAACELLGRTRDEAIALNAADIAPPGVDVAAWWRAFLEAGSACGELIVVRSDGCLRVADFSATANITPGRHLSVLRDVTEQKRARQYQQVQSAVMRRLGQASSIDEALRDLLPELATDLDLDLGLLWKVDAAADQLRLEEAWIRPDLPPFSQAQLESFRVLERGQGLAGRVRADGVPLVSDDVEDSDDPVFRRLREDLSAHAAFAVPIGAPGQVDAVIGLAGRRRLIAPDELLAVAEDIAEQFAQFIRRGRAEDALRRSEATLAAAERTAHLGSWLWDAGKGELYWSDEHYRILGLEPGSVRATPDLWLQAVHAEDRARVVTAVGKSIEHGEPFELEYRVRRPDGSERIVVSRGERPTVESGEIARILGSVQDVTAQRSLEAQFRQVQKLEAIGQLAGGVAHDFNNLLTAILGNTDAILSEIAPEHPFYEDLDEVRQASLRAAAVTRQLLAFSRRQTLQPQSLRPSELIAGMHRMLERIIGEDIELHSSSDGDGYVLVDPGQLEQVVLNLVVNARDAMERGGRIEIAAGRVKLEQALLEQHAEIPPGSYVTLSVRDTGSGMDAATQARIFEPFFTTKEAGKGTGIGLSTVYGIVRQSGGHITVDSAPGRGTLFTLYLPPSAPPGGRVRKSSTAPSRLRGGETLLLVEDEPSVRRATRRILRANGYRVIEAAAAAEALAVLGDAERGVDLVLTDIVMPGLDGRELSEKVVGIRPSLRCLYMSGHSYDALSRRGALPEHASFLQKPFTSHALLKKIREVLER